MSDPSPSYSDATAQSTSDSPQGEVRLEGLGRRLTLLVRLANWGRPPVPRCTRPERPRSPPRTPTPRWPEDADGSG
ncbi:hypothetical protein NHJ6243_005128 [Beauveria neobassiana]